MEEKAYKTHIDVLEFHFKNEVTGTDEVKLHQIIEFTVQRPKDGSLTERAIIVHRQGSSLDYKLELNITARVVFDFGEEPITLDNQSFLEQYDTQAYAEFYQKIHDALSVMGAEWAFPEIPLPKRSN